MTKIAFTVCYFFYGDNMKVKIYDEESETDLEEDINNFLDEFEEINVIDIKYQVSSSIYSEEQIFCFSAMIIYE